MDTAKSTVLITGGASGIGLGALLFVLIQLMRTQTANEHEHRIG